VTERENPTLFTLSKREGGRAFDHKKGGGQKTVPTEGVKKRSDSGPVAATKSKTQKKGGCTRERKSSERKKQPLTTCGDRDEGRHCKFVKK